MNSKQKFYTSLAFVLLDSALIIGLLFVAKEKFWPVVGLSITLGISGNLRGAMRLR